MSDRKEYEKYIYLDTDMEQDSYSLFDDRVWTSNIEDIDGGDNFADYCNEFFRMLDEEEYYDNW